jgi:hypothetical protein
MRLLEEVVRAASGYETIKRVLVWGSFISEKPEPNDLDYSILVSVDHYRTTVHAEDRRFLVPVDARQFYGVDKSHLVIKDYPIERYAESLLFLCSARKGTPRGIVEIALRGQMEEPTR